MKKTSWSHIHLHRVMLEDAQRTLAYKKAIAKIVKPKDTILDLGCGLGILTFFAAQRKSKKIYAIDNANIIHLAKRIAQRNAFKTPIEFIQKDIHTFKPKEPLDIIIHEQIGGFLWEENCIKKIAFIRDKFLKKGGKILPSKIDLYFVPTSAYSDFDEALDFWSHKYHNIDFSALSDELFSQNYKHAFFPSTIQLHNTKTFLATPKKVYTLNFHKETKLPSTIKTHFTINKSGNFNGICGFFKIHLDKDIILTTAPKTKNTHWGQMFLPNPNRRKIKRGERITFQLNPHIDPMKWVYTIK